MFIKFFGLSRARNSWEYVAIATDCIAAMVSSFKDTKDGSGDMIVVITLKNGTENEWEVFKEDDKQKIRQFGE